MKGALYVESSAVVRVTVERHTLLRSRIEAAKKLTTSTLMEAEARRAIIRAERDGRIDARHRRESEAWLRNLLGECSIVAVDEAILARAVLDFPVEPVRTLDAIHLASAIHFADLVGALTMVSCDDRVRDNAKALGWKVLPA